MARKTWFALGVLAGALAAGGAVIVLVGRNLACGGCGRRFFFGAFVESRGWSVTNLPHRHHYLLDPDRLAVIETAQYQWAVLHRNHDIHNYRDVLDRLAAMDAQAFREATAAVRFAERSATPVDLYWDEAEGSFEMEPPAD